MILRSAMARDAVVMADIQNQLIRIGGTTAHQAQKPALQVRRDYIDGPDCLCCTVAEDRLRVMGWQAVGRHPALPTGWGDIGSYVRPGLQARGIGAALFGQTLRACRALGLLALNATIRADNAAGLAYYAWMGFVDYGHDPDFALQDGRVVGRIHRVLHL